MAPSNACAMFMPYVRRLIVLLVPMIIICSTMSEADLGKPSGVHKDIACARYLVPQDLAFVCAT